MNIIVTGASKGIGEQIVRKLAAQKRHTLILIARDKEKMKVLTEELTILHPETHIYSIVYDLNQTEVISEILIPQIFEITHSVDILINNAGFLVNTPFLEISEEILQKHYRINVFSPILLMKNLFEALKASSSGHIVNVGTMGAVQGSQKFPGLSPYSSGKAALANFTEALAEEWKEYGIRVNYLALGAVDTEMFEEAFPGKSALVSAEEMGRYIADFALTGGHLYNGKIIPVSLSTP